MPGQVLHVFERYVLIEQIGDDRHAETVRREKLRQARIIQPPLHHPADRVRAVIIACQCFGLVRGAEEGGAARIVSDPRRLDVFVDPPL